MRYYSSKVEVFKVGRMIKRKHYKFFHQNLLSLLNSSANALDGRYYFKCFAYRYIHFLECSVTCYYYYPNFTDEETGAESKEAGI